MSGPCSRRQLLRRLGVVTLGGIAGCNDVTPPTNQRTTEPTESPSTSPRTTTGIHPQTETQTATPTETETATATETPDGESPTHLVQTKDLAARDGGRLPGVFADVVGDDGILCAGSLDGEIWLARFDSTLDLKWSQVYSDWDVGDRTDFTVNVSPAGGYLVGGIPETNEDEVGVFKTDSRGAVQWQRRFGAAFANSAENVWFVSLANGKYLCAWTVLFSHGAETHVRGFDGPKGSVQWEITYDTLATQYIQRTEDRGWFLKGYEVGGDTIMQELGPDGSQRWNETLDKFHSARPTEAGYVLWATNEDSVRVRTLDHNRQEQWTRTYDKSGSALAVLTETDDGGYVLANEDDEGMWMTVLGPDGDVRSRNKYGVAPGEVIEPLGLASTDDQYVAVGGFDDYQRRDDGWVLAVEK